MPLAYSDHPQGAPGSPAAVANGCTCPVSDNANGAGIGGGHYWIQRGCPVHDNGVTAMVIMPVSPPN